MKTLINFDDFLKLDIRIGTIIEVNDFEKERKLAYQLIIDFGKLGIKNASAQITKLYSKDQLLNKQIIAVVNFKPKQIANFKSECLILGIENDSHEVVLLKSSSTVINGSEVN